MIRFLKRIHACWYIFSVVFSFLLFSPFFYYYSRKPSRYLTLNWFRKGFAFLSSALAGVFYKHVYETNVVWDKPYIVCANHTSNLDIAAITSIMHGNFAFLGKEELLHNPVFSIFFKTIEEFVGRFGSSLGFILTCNLLGFPKITVQHTHSPREEKYYKNNNKCVTTFQNCSSILLEYEKCKNNYNCNFDKLDKLKNDYEYCSNISI